MRTSAVLIALGGLACIASAQVRTRIVFPNGTNSYAAPPGAAVLVSVYASGLPAIGTQIPWTTPPGTGQVGQYIGFLGVAFDMQGSGPASWSGLTIAPPFHSGPPFGNPGTASGTNVNNIGISVGFNAPVTAAEILLWQGTVTVGASVVNLATAVRPVGAPPQTGFEVALDGIVGLYVTHFLSVQNGTGQVGNIPSPAGAAVLGFGVLALARRRRRAQS